MDGKRVLITGAARGIGAALGKRLTDRGAQVALAGLEPEMLEATAESIGAPWWPLDVADRAQVQGVVDQAAETLGGLDVVVANAGVAAQLPIVGGDPDIFSSTFAVNVFGTYNTLRAAGRHISHPSGYALVISSLGAIVNLPLLGAYSSSKAAVEALGNTLRQELRPYGAKAGVAYFAELDTDMTHRGWETEAARHFLKGRHISGVTPLSVGIDALERGITRRSRIVVAPGWVRAVIPIRPLAQRAMELRLRSGLAEVLEIAQNEAVTLTTSQPEHLL